MIVPKRIAVFTSGSGSNLQALIDTYYAGNLKHGEIALVVGSKPGIGALERAQTNGIAHCVMSKKAYPDQDKFDHHLLARLEEHRIDIIVLAGYLGILSETVVSHFPRAILNIHPSLIPSFCGMGFYGHHVHEAVLNSGVKLTGATVHFVDAGVDSGAILLQESCPVLPSDTASTIQKRVLGLEHTMLPKAVEALCAEKVRWFPTGNRAYIVEN